jgi:putative flippase GtrA
MALPAHGLYSRIRPMVPELIKFCVVGVIGTVIDLGGAALLHSKYHVEPLAAKAISVTAATTFTYLGARYWTFKHRENQPVRREAMLFFVLNIAGLLIAEAVIGLVTYVMGLRGALDYNAASVIGTGLGTVFRFYAYRKWVFLAPSEQPPAAPADGVAALPDYPPWELDPAYFAAEVLSTESGPHSSSPWDREPSLWDREPASPWGREPEPAVRHAAPLPQRETTERFAPAAPGMPLSAPVPQDAGRTQAGAAAPRPAGRHRKS